MRCEPRLKDDAVPSKFLVPEFSEACTKLTLQGIIEIDRSENSIVSLGETNITSELTSVEIQDSIPAGSSQSENFIEDSNQLEHLLEKLERLKKDNENLKESLHQKVRSINEKDKIIHERDKIINEKNKIINEKQKIIDEKEKKLEKKDKTLGIKKKTISKFQRQEKKYKEILNRIFTPGQIKMLINENRKQVKWCSDDISSAMSLHSVSARAYRFIRKTMKVPLPSVSTLRNWAQKFDVTPGILNGVLRIMKLKGESMTVLERLTVLSYDEVYISNDIAINRRDEQIIGPHKTTQVVMARGLFNKWKQPVFYNYDRAMDKKLLENIIMKLYENGFTVVATTSDLGSSNSIVKNYLKIETQENQQCYFEHPSDNKLLIHVFADMPHLMKLARNHFLDSGFFYKGIHLTKKILEQILQNRGEGDDMTMAYKLTEKHLTVRGTERQRVSMAVQVFSNSVAASIKSFGTKGYIENWETASYVVQLFNDWFDVLNSRKMYGTRKGLHAYGIELEHQNRILREMDQFIKEMRVGTHKSMIPFQRGISLTCNSLPSLFNYLQDTFGHDQVKYLMTYRLNQDVLENTFSYIRRMGGNNDHPNALQFQHRLRWYILGKYSMDFFSLQTNTVPVDKDSSLINAHDISNCMADDAYVLTTIFPENSSIKENSESIETEKLEESQAREDPAHIVDCESLRIIKEFAYSPMERDDNSEGEYQIKKNNKGTMI